MERPLTPSTWRARLRAVGELWAAFLAVDVLTVVIASALIRGREEVAADVFRTAAHTVGLASKPLEQGLAGLGAPEELRLMAINGLAVLAFALILPLLRLSDPTRGGRWARRMEKVETSAVGTLLLLPYYLLWPSRTFRQTRARRLRPFCALGVIGFLFPVGLGVQSGLLSAARSPGTGMRLVAARIVEGWAWTLPHGVFELTAMFLPLATLTLVYRAIAPALVAGDPTVVADVIRSETGLRQVRGWIVAALVLIVVAAVLEANVTPSFAAAVERVTAVLR